MLNNTPSLLTTPLSSNMYLYSSNFDQLNQQFKIPNLFTQTIQKDYSPHSQLALSTKIKIKNKEEIDTLSLARKKIKSCAAISIDNKPKQFDKVIVIEVFSSYLEDEPHIIHEIIGNSEAGWNLAKKFHSGTRYIWSLNHKMTDQLMQGKVTPFINYEKVVNLIHPNPQEVLNLTGASKIFIVAQGNLEKNQLADLEPGAFLELLEYDLEIKKIAEIEFIVCKLAKNSSYLDEVKNYFERNQSSTNIISYPTLITVDQEGKVIGFPD